MNSALQRARSGLRKRLPEERELSMPPTPGVWTGRNTVVQGWIDGGFTHFDLPAMLRAVDGAR
jgi:hypothetical protein